jgi:filamentous hemagglutinin family protein
MAAVNRNRTKFRVLCSWSPHVLFSLIAFHISAGLAQVPTSPITSSGLNTHISGPISVGGKTQYDITGGTRAGANLFHSFGDFNVLNNNIANFQNETGLATSNILGRVTGGNVSNIFGTIQTTAFENANLFLMNPAGIVFGPNASLNVGGSVAFTTADYLRLADNGRFNAIPNATADALLSTAPVAAYGFLVANPVAITVQGSQLKIPEGHQISLIGGNIAIQEGTLENERTESAHLSAPRGEINLATAKSAGEFLQDLTAAPNINGASFRSFGSAHFASGSTVNVSQSGNGMVSTRGGQLVLEIQNAILDTAGTYDATTVAPRQDTIVLAPGSSIITESSSTDQAPAIHLKADRISIQGTGIPDTSANSPPKIMFTGIKSNTQGGGNAGNIVLTATGDVEITNLANLESTSAPNSDTASRQPIRITGNAGEITLTSTHRNILITKFSTVTSQTFNSDGNTGKVTALAPQGNVVLNDSVFFTSIRGAGKAGETKIVASNLELRNSVISDDNFGPLKPGGINIALAGNLTLSDASVIATTSVSPTDAPAADINLTAKDIIVTGGSIINSGSFRSGPGGNLNIVTDSLRISDGAEVSSGSTRAPNRGLLLSILGNINPTGLGGDITIQANAGPAGSVVIDGQGSGIFANTEGTGAGGNILLTAGKFISVTNGGAISASSTSSGNAGNIKIDAGRQLSIQNSGITTEAQKARGGNIEVIATDRIRLANGQISTSVLEGAGDSGRISIDPKEVIVQNNSAILSQAVQGNGGDISIRTLRFLQDPTSLVDASSQFGQSGKVTIQSSTSNLSGTVAQLSSKTDQTQPLLQNRCVALAGSEQSTFLVSGRDTLPNEPGGWLSSPVSMEHLTGEDIEHATGLIASARKLNESQATITRVAKGEVLSLRRLTPPGFLVRTFATGSTGCPS